MEKKVNGITEYATKKITWEEKVFTREIGDEADGPAEAIVSESVVEKTCYCYPSDKEDYENIIKSKTNAANIVVELCKAPRK